MLVQGLDTLSRSYTSAPPYSQHYDGDLGLRQSGLQIIVADWFTTGLAGETVSIALLGISDSGLGDIC